ncbi:hypothetical protein AB0I55_06815 [Actinocatenispora sera]|uniref:hypothetical protein n=1 Tax=Actinocatenispora sera TaxID=390989 RepID=UPI0033CFCBDA
MMCTSTSEPETGLPQQYRIGTCVTVAGQRGSVIGIDHEHGWLEVDVDRVGQQWIEIAYAQSDNRNL